MSTIRKIRFAVWRRILSRPVAKWYLRKKGARFGERPCLVGMPEISGSVRLGDDCTLVSSQLANPLGLFRPCIIQAVNHSGASGHIVVGDRFSASGVCINARMSITIGNDVMVGANATIIDNDFHAHEPHSRSDPMHVPAKPIVINDHVWIGTNAVILKGVRIGKGAVVGANCVVARDVPAGATVVGNPGRIISRGSSSE